VEGKRGLEEEKERGKLEGKRVSEEERWKKGNWKKGNWKEGGHDERGKKQGKRRMVGKRGREDWMRKRRGF
jgi:hypothetical protein